MEEVVAKLVGIEEQEKRKVLKFDNLGTVSEFKTDGEYVCSKEAIVGKTYKVKFTTTKKGEYTYKNLKGSLIETDEKPSSSNQAQGRDDNYWKEKDRKMLWLGCLKDAIETAKLLSDAGHLKEINLGTIQALTNTYIEAIEQGKDHAKFEFEKFYVAEEKV